MYYSTISSIVLIKINCLKKRQDNHSRSNSIHKILEITKSATTDQMKKAYRTMAKKYHPNKVEHLGEEHKKGAEEKFKQIQKAYEQLQKERGF